jgi:hypothetical protein
LRATSTSAESEGSELALAIRPAMIGSRSPA